MSVAGNGMISRNDVPFCSVCRRALSRVLDLYSR